MFNIYYAFRYGNELWMFDCGEGTQTQLMKSNLKAGKITRIFITHLHGDHLYGISGLLCTISQSNQRNEPVAIYGPQGLAKYLRVTLGLSRSDLCFRFKVIEMIPTDDMWKEGDKMLCNISPTDQPERHPCEDAGSIVLPEMVDDVPQWTLIDNGPLTVVAGKLDHRIPSFGFVIQEKTLAGNISIEKLKQFGLEPGPICKRLKSGETVDTPNGDSVTWSDIAGPDQPGRKVVICGDSCDSSALAKLAYGADVFIHEATLENSLRDTAVERGHSTPEMASRFALQAKAHLLYLTHFSQRYTESSGKQKTKTIKDLLGEAREVFGPNCEVAEDLLLFPVKHKRDSNQ